MKELKFREDGSAVTRLERIDTRAECKCPACGRNIQAFEIFQYCPGCGQKLDWSVLDDWDIGESHDKRRRVERT